MKLKHKQALKTKLSPTLKSWFPILQSSTMELEEVLSDFITHNPFVEIKSNIQEQIPPSIPTRQINHSSSISHKYSMSSKIEALSVYESSIYEIIESQISPPLFPTIRSQKIAHMIIEEINSEGYFEGDINEIAKCCDASITEVENVRKRFSKINPSGIGALDSVESMVFQLDDFDISDELYDLSFAIISNLQDHIKHKKHPLYNEAIKIIKKLKIPPAIDYAQKDSQIIPDIFIVYNTDGFEVSINDSHYPDIVISKTNLKDSTIKAKIKEARDLIDAISMRKATIRKIGLMLLEYQYDFFIGGSIKPMKLKDIAKDLGHSPSTISRAVANKYLECNRGIFPLKSFFSTAISGDTSNTSIKDFINNLVKSESKSAPLSDIKILEFVESEFSVKMVRRTITKYRQQLDIPSSNERKRLYEITI